MDDRVATVQTICDAILMRHCLRFREGRATVVVEPHAIGANNKGMPVLLAWPLEIAEADARPTSFNLFKLEHIEEVCILDWPFEKARPGYAEAKRVIERILKQL